MPLQRLNAYKAVWFDAGDTLITIHGSYRLLQNVLAAYDVKCSESQIVPVLEAAFNQLYYSHEAGYDGACTPESDREYWLRFYEFVLERLGIINLFSEEVIHRICHELYEVYISPQYYTLFDDVVPLLQMLKMRGHRLAVISNFAPTLENILRDKGVADYFELIVVSTLVGIEKPDPGIFQYALDQTGLRPSEVLYIGDHTVNDIWAPNQLGIEALRLKRYDYQQGEGMTSLLQLLDH